MGEIPDFLAKRLVAVGLIAPREKRQEDATKLGEFIDAYLLSRTDFKPRTRINFRQVRRDLVARFGEDKPLRDVTLGDADEWRRWLLTRDMAEKVLAACPDNEWRLIFALARFGGLRTPSETLLLRWDDVNWRTQLERIIHRAGLIAWPKLFQNLRSTRETELAETTPLHVVTAWLGNSQLIAAKHYLQVTDEHFQKATQNPTQNRAEIGQTAAKAVIRPLRDNEKGPEFPGLSRPFSSVGFMAVPPTGVEPVS